MFASTKGVEGCLLIIHMKMMVIETCGTRTYARRTRFFDDVDDVVDDDVCDQNLCDKNIGEKKGKKDGTEETPADQPVGAQLRPQHEVDVPGGNADNGGGGDFDSDGGDSSGNGDA